MATLSIIELIIAYAPDSPDFNVSIPRIANFIKSQSRHISPKLQCVTKYLSLLILWSRRGKESLIKSDSDNPNDKDSGNGSRNENQKENGNENTSKNENEKWGLEWQRPTLKTKTTNENKNKKHEKKNKTKQNKTKLN